MFDSHNTEVQEYEGHPKQFGIKLTDLTPELFLKVLQLHDSVTGGHAVDEITDDRDALAVKIEEINEAIKRSGLSDHRFFGGGGLETKFFVKKAWSTKSGEDAYYFQVKPNMTENDLKRKPEALQWDIDFRKEVSALLEESGVGVQITEV